MPAIDEPGELLEPRHREALGRLREVEEMMRHRARARPVTAWPCRRPSPGRPASNRPSRSRRRVPAPGPWRLGLAGRRGSDEGQQGRGAHRRTGQTATVADRRGHDLAGEVVRRGVGDAGLRRTCPGSSAAAQVHDAIRAGAGLGRDALLVGAFDQHLHRLADLRPCLGRWTSAPAAPSAGRSAPARPPWGPGRRTRPPACRDAASTGT